MHSSRRSKLQIKFLCSWTCSIRIFMNSTLIMDPVHLNKLFSISNWWFLIPCYYQNLRGDFEKHPLFQQTSHRLVHHFISFVYFNTLFHAFLHLTPKSKATSHGLVHRFISSVYFNTLFHVFLHLTPKSKATSHGLVHRFISSVYFNTLFHAFLHLTPFICVLG